MTNYEALELMLDKLMDYLHEISADWRFEVPKRGREQEHAQTHQMVDCVKDMMEHYKEAAE